MQRNKKTRKTDPGTARKERLARYRKRETQVRITQLKIKEI